MTARAVALALIGAVALSAAALPSFADAPLPAAFPADEAALESLRAQGDLDGQRRHLWRVLEQASRPLSPDGPAAFLDWYGAAETFADDSPAASPARPRTPVAAFGQTAAARRAAAASPLPPLVMRTHYNAAAYRHLRAHGLHRVATLMALRDDGATTVPAFPRDAIVAKSAWWPVPARGVAALPVWDESDNPPQAAGNDYPSWRRRVAVCDTGVTARRVDVELLGRIGRRLPCVGIERFVQVTLDDALAAELMSDPAARKLAGMVLARPLQAGDKLVLVALHVATREIADWVWGTFWWHDRAAFDVDGNVARPAASPWRDYRLAVAFDAERPRAGDGRPHVAYNPWFEARFPDTGQGGGVASNCMSCHARAAFPSRDPFLVTRGRSDAGRPPDGRPPLETSALWSIPLEAY